MSSIKELFEDAIRFEMSSFAHYLLHLLQEGKVKFDDDKSVLDFVEADNRKVQKLIGHNHLKFSTIKVFALKHSENLFQFIYANSRDEAINYFKKVLRKHPINCYEYPLYFEIARGNRVVSFRELKKEFSSFPALIGYYEREYAHL